jgi:ABC-type nickel/cobalt efflux system permease component RcnA
VVLAMMGASEMMKAISATEAVPPHPHQNQRRDGHDGHRLQQDCVGVEHAPHPARLREEQRDEHAEDAGDQAARGFFGGDEKTT